MKREILIIILIHIAISSIGQQCPKMIIEAQYKKRYYPEGDQLAQQYALIGMYNESLIEEDRFYNKDNGRFVSNDTAIEFRNAYPYIYNATKNNDIVILNECHYDPKHRTVLYSILDSIKKNGVQSIFLETFAYFKNDSSFFARNPDKHWGVYTSENVYNQTINKMQLMHFNLYSYEFNPGNQLDTTSIGNKKYIIDKEDVNWMPVEADNFIIAQLYSKEDYVRRDAEQAVHIYQKMRSNKIQKALIYCGYSHGWKVNGYMAGILQHLLNKKVFSIDQTLLNEHSDWKHENPLYTKYANTTYPIVFIDKRQQPLHSIYFSDSNYSTDTLVDMVIASPRTIYKNNRPTWLELNGDRKRYTLSTFIDVGEFSNDFLVAIYEGNDYELAKFEAIPVDVFQVQNGAENYDVILVPHKKYHLFAYRDGKIITEKIIEGL